MLIFKNKYLKAFSPLALELPPILYKFMNISSKNTAIISEIAQTHNCLIHFLFICLFSKIETKILYSFNIHIYTYCHYNTFYKFHRINIKEIKNI